MEENQKKAQKIIGISHPSRLSFKRFLEIIRDESGLTQEEFLKHKIMIPVLDLKTFEKIKYNKHLSFVLEKRTEEELKDQNYEKELKKIEENLIQIETELNEFYAKTNIIQYYKNKKNNPIELVLNFPYNKNVQFSKFTLEMNNKKVISKVIDKEKAEEKYSDAIASGNTGAMTKKEENNIKVLVGNIPGNSIVKLTSEFIQFLNIEDMSYCYSTIKNFPTFHGQNFQNKLHQIQAKINLKTFSKITRLITKGFNINTENGGNKSNLNNQNNINCPTINFNENYMECEIKYYFLNNNLKKSLKNDELKILFRTESMNKLNLLTQYDEKKR